MSSTGSACPRRALSVRFTAPTAFDSARRARRAVRRSVRRSRDTARSRTVWRRRRPPCGSRKYSSSAPSATPPAVATASTHGMLSESARLRARRLVSGTRAALRVMATSSSSTPRNGTPRGAAALSPPWMPSRHRVDLPRDPGPPWAQAVRRLPGTRPRDPGLHRRARASPSTAADHDGQQQRRARVPGGRSGVALPLRARRQPGAAGRPGPRTEMDAHPSSYAVMAKEMAREGKLESPPSPDTPAVSDQRNYLYAEVTKATGYPVAPAPAPGSWVGVALAVQLRGNDRWYTSNHDVPDWSI